MDLLIAILFALGVNVTPDTFNQNFVAQHQHEVENAMYIINNHKWHPDATAPGGVVIDDDAHN